MPSSIAGLLDAKDQQILALLSENARRSLGGIAALIGLSAPAVKRRVDRLEAEGIIQGYTTILDHSRLGPPLEAFIELRFGGTERVDAIAGIGEHVSQVQAVFTIAGDPDALVWIRVADVADLKRVVDQLRGSGRVTGTKTLLVLGTSSPR